MRCQDDSCDGSHCRKCGGHFMDFYTSATICSSCEMEEAQKNQVPTHVHCELDTENNKLNVFFGSEKIAEVKADNPAVYTYRVHFFKFVNDLSDMDFQIISDCWYEMQYQINDALNKQNG